ncbi:MAG: Smr/MutS family protein [Rhodocyclales bacterium]|nr:Smr/MutS family protein [Rhodocyclales bacterium]
MSGRKPGDRLPGEDDARALFRAAVGDATPLGSDRVHHEPPPPPAVPRQRQRDEQAALAESISAPDLLDLHLEGGDEAAWLRPGLSPGVLRDLRRGRWVVQAHLDLHGMNRDEARHQVGLFLGECTTRGHRCVRIVHGKGLGSPGREPVLKRLVLGWLSQSKAVLAFCHARPSDGGSGAVVVLLSPPRPSAAGRKA